MIGEEVIQNAEIDKISIVLENSQIFDLHDILPLLEKRCKKARRPWRIGRRIKSAKAAFFTAVDEVADDMPPVQQ